MKLLGTRTGPAVVAIALAVGCGPKPVTVRTPDAWAVEIETAPAAFQGRELVVEGQLLIDGDRSRLWSQSARTSVEVVFASSCAARSDRNVIEFLDRMRVASRPDFPYRGLTIMRLRTRRAWVTLEGHVEPVLGDTQPLMWPALHRFVVSRVVAVRPMVSPDLQ
jgi:hypothetical protein